MSAVAPSILNNTRPYASAERPHTFLRGYPLSLKSGTEAGELLKEDKSS